MSRLSKSFALAQKRNAATNVASIEGKEIHGGSVPQACKSATLEQFRCQILYKTAVTLSFQTIYLDSLRTRVHTRLVPKGGTGSYGLQDRRQGCVSKSRRWDDRAS